MPEYWHITWVTHNSRISERMVKYRAQRGEPVLLDESAELIITESISEIIHKYSFKVMAYNICRDHIHLIIDSEAEKLPSIVKTLKSLSSIHFKKLKNKQSDIGYHLWAQKFNRWFIESEEQFLNTVRYIIHNREKHRLPQNNGLQPLVVGMLQVCGNAEYVQTYSDEMNRRINDSAHSVLDEMCGCTDIDTIG